MLTHVKKIISSVLIMTMLISSVSVAYAIDTDVSSSATALTKTEISAIAVQAFPEYADKILATPSTSASILNNASSDPFGEVTVYETRALSDTESVTYIEYASSLAVVGVSQVTSVTASSSGSGYSSKTVDVHVMCSGAVNSFLLSGFQYTLVNSGYDQINNIGKFYDTATGATVSSSSSNKKETSSKAAYAKYPALFESTLGGVVLSVTIEFRVAKDSFKIYAGSTQI